MENMCSNCGFYKTPPLFWGGSTEPLLCDCPKERSYSEEEVKNILFEWSVYKVNTAFSDGEIMDYEQWFEQFKKK